MFNFSTAGPSQAGSPFGPTKPASGTKQSATTQAAAPVTPPITSYRGTGPAQNGNPVPGNGNEDVGTLYLEPSTYDRKGKQKWVDSGRHVAAVAGPMGGETAAWITKSRSEGAEPSTKSQNESLSLSDRSVYFTSPHLLPDPVLTFYTETYTLFASLQRIVATSIRLPARTAGIDARGSGVAGVWDKSGHLIELSGILGPPGSETVGHMRRLVGMYLEELARLRGMPGLDSQERAKWAEVYHVFRLAETLYLPQDGRGEGLLGEELLDWVNDVDPQPDNALGTGIMSSREPWSHPSFWPFVTRCLLRGFFIPASSFLRTLSSHPNPTLSRISTILSTQLTLLPRSHDTASFPLDNQFIAAHRTWLNRFRTELAAATGGRKRGEWLDDGKGEKKKWNKLEGDLIVLVELLEGKPERVLEEAADWREAIGAWGILVDLNLRRDDLPQSMKKILATIPADPYLVSHAIQTSLCQGEIVSALEGCHNLDPWLAAHLGDIFDKLALVPDDEERFEISLRDYFILDYVDVLSGNPKHGAVWRIAADYLSAAGEEGRARLKTHILHTALGLRSDEEQDNRGTLITSAADAGDGMEVEEKIDPRLEHFAELREACVELRLEEEWRIISHCMADRLVRREEYGIAATMYFQAEDGDGLARLADKVLDTYISQGEKEYLRILDTLPTTLLNEAPLAYQQLQLQLSNQPGSSGASGGSAISMFASRLAFLAEFRDYLLFLTQDDKPAAAERLVGLLTSGIAPVDCWAILLVESIPLLEGSDVLFSSSDTFELMRILEEVTANSRWNPKDYLSHLRSRLSIQSGQDTDATTTSQAGGEWRSASGKLEEVRLALARNLARALVVGFDNPF